MPNWCSTAYTFEGDAQEVKALYELMKELEEKEKPAIENGFGTAWLGCLVDALGGDWHDVQCRGYWDGLTFDGHVLTFYTETAWATCNEVFNLVCAAFPSLHYYYQAEEPGMCDYYTNDIEGRYYPDRYVVNLITDRGEWYNEYFEDLPGLYEWLEEIADVPINSEQDVQALKQRWEEINPDAFINIYEFKVFDD